LSFAISPSEWTKAATPRQEQDQLREGCMEQILLLLFSRKVGTPNNDVRPKGGGKALGPEISIFSSE
jgi:hypothetical protein